MNTNKGRTEMNELPTEERCRQVIQSVTKPGVMEFFEAHERAAIDHWAIERGIKPTQFTSTELAQRILSDHYGAPSGVPERDEATGTGPATQDRPADIWRDNPPATVTQRDGTDENLELRPGERWATPEEKKAYEKHLAESTRKLEPKLELTPEERWNKQMDRSEAVMLRQERIQVKEEQQHDRMDQILDMAQKVLVSFIAKIGGPATAADIERTHELAKEYAWEKSKAMIGTMPVKPETESAVPVGTVKAGKLDPINQAPSGQFPNIKRDQGFKLGGVGHVPIVPKEDYVLTKTQTDAKTYTDPKPKPDAWATTEPKGWPTQASKDEEIAELRQIVEDQKAIITNLDKRLEAGRKRGQMLRDLLSKEV